MDRAYTDADLDAAIAAISKPGRLDHAQEIVAQVAPALQRMLAISVMNCLRFDPRRKPSRQPKSQPTLRGRP